MHNLIYIIRKQQTKPNLISIYKITGPHFSNVPQRTRLRNCYRLDKTKEK
jgi:hypothetical protein